MASQSFVQAAYWYSDTGFPVPNIDSQLFTHLFCAFADLKNQTFQVTISPANLMRFSTFTETVRKRKPSVKTLLAIGGGGGSAMADAFASMASQADRRRAFIESSIRIVRSNNFDGLDLDWEYPDNPTKMANFGLLLREWRTAIDNESATSRRSPLLLTAAVFRSPRHFSSNNYPVQAMSNSLDWINVMAYDFYGAGWSDVTGPPAALHDPRPGSTVSGDHGVTSWMQSGMPARKIVLGFPFYGRAWTLANPGNNSFFAPTNGAAALGDAVRYGPIIIDFIARNNATRRYDPNYVSNYCFFRNYMDRLR